MLHKLSIGVFLLLTISLTSTLACPNNYNGYLVHVDNNKFYRCDDGSATVMSCPLGHEFHPKLKICLTPSLEQLLKFLSNVRGTSSSSSSLLKEEDLPECLRNQTSTIYFPHETYCTKFYACSNGLLTVMVCPAGLEFNVNTKNCDWISDSGCISQTTPNANPTTTPKTTSPETTTRKPTTPETTTPKPTTPEPTTPKPTTPEPTTPEPTTSKPTTPEPTTPKPTTEPTTPKPTTPEPTTPKPTPEPPCSDSSFTGFVPHESDCHKYYLCLSGVPVVLSCQSGMEFDVEIKECVKISDNGCTASQSKIFFKYLKVQYGTLVYKKKL